MCVYEVKYMYMCVQSFLFHFYTNKIKYRMSPVKTSEISRIEYLEYLEYLEKKYLYLEYLEKYKFYKKDFK